MRMARLTAAGLLMDDFNCFFFSCSAKRSSDGNNLIAEQQIKAVLNLALKPLKTREQGNFDVLLPVNTVKFCYDPARSLTYSRQNCSKCTVDFLREHIL